MVSNQKKQKNQSFSDYGPVETPPPRPHSLKSFGFFCFLVRNHAFGALGFGFLWFLWFFIGFWDWVLRKPNKKPPGGSCAHLACSGRTRSPRASIDLWFGILSFSEETPISTGVLSDAPPTPQVQR